jgi:hypothetical protein
MIKNKVILNLLIFQYLVLLILAIQNFPWIFLLYLKRNLNISIDFQADRNNFFHEFLDNY